MRAVLEVIEGTSQPGQLLELAGGRMVMGRHPSCQILLDSVPVSRNHAVIVEAHGKYCIEEMRSRGGTRVNGVRCVGPTELKAGDVIRVANVILRFHDVYPF